MTGGFAECSCAEENHGLLSWLPSGKLAELWKIPDLYVDEIPITTSTLRGFFQLAMFHYWRITHTIILFDKKPPIILLAT